MVYDGHRWVAGPKTSIKEFARVVSRKVNTERKQELTKAAFYGGVLDILKHDPAFAALGSEFDVNTDWLNTPAGVLDLTTSQLMQHDPLNRLSKITSVAPSPEGGRLFLDSLHDICGGDLELMNFHQVSLGAILSGAPEVHWMLFWCGGGRNGKNLFADLVFDVNASPEEGGGPLGSPLGSRSA